MQVFRCNAAERGKAGTPVALGKTSALTALGNSAYRVVTAMQSVVSLIQLGVGNEYKYE
jgi:hypothetical protein